MKRKEEGTWEEVMGKGMEPKTCISWAWRSNNQRTSKRNIRTLKAFWRPLLYIAPHYYPERQLELPCLYLVEMVLKIQIKISNLLTSL